MTLPKTDNEKYLKQVFDEHFHHLVLSAFRYLQNYDQAEDIVQDVFVKLWQNIDELKQEKNLKSYLFKAVKNSCLNFLRHIKVRQQFVADSKVLNASSEEITEDSPSSEEINNRVHGAVNKLPDHWREAFILSKYDKLKYIEIAEKLNISHKTVEKYISKSLQFLRNELKDLLLIGVLILKFLKNTVG